MFGGDVPDIDNALARMREQEPNVLLPIELEDMASKRNAQIEAEGARARASPPRRGGGVKKVGFLFLES